MLSLWALWLGTPAPALAQTEVPAATVPTPSDSELSAVAWTLKIDAPGALRDLLAQHLDLARYAERTTERTTERITQGELARLVAAAPTQARSLLETEGYFSATISTRLDPAQAGRVTVHVVVVPGPQTQVASVQIEVAGALSSASETPGAGTAEAQAQAQAQALVARLRREFALGVGEPFTQSAWGSAKTALLNRLRAEGYGLASYSGTHAQVNAEQHSAALTLVADSGPLLRIGNTRVEGLRHVRPDAINALQPYTLGMPLREQVLQDFQDRLVKTNLFDTVAVSAAPEWLENPGQVDSSATELLVPVVVTLHERALNQATVGIGASDTTGARITLEHLRQDILGTGWSAKTKLQLGQTERGLSLDLVSPPQPGPYRNLLSGAIKRSEASGLAVLSQTLRVGRTQDTEHIDRLYYLQYQRDVTRARSTGAVTDEASALTANYQWVWRQLDHPILPTQGYGLSAEVGGGRSFHTSDDSGFFGRGTARLTGYWPIGGPLGTLYSQARLQVGQVFADPSVNVPYTQLFRAGGDDSVRGYANQALGPVDATGTAIGGHVLGTASLEIARPISRRQPAFWLAAFVDAGNAAVNWSQFEPALGYGVGLRWRSPVGPLRIDLAYGDKARRARLHFTVGIVF